MPILHGVFNRKRHHVFKTMSFFFLFLSYSCFEVFYLCVGNGINYLVEMCCLWNGLQRNFLTLFKLVMLWCLLFFIFSRVFNIVFSDVAIILLYFINLHVSLCQLFAVFSKFLALLLSSSFFSSSVFFFLVTTGQSGLLK